MTQGTKVMLAASVVALSALSARAGSCYIGAPTHGVYCSVSEAQCASDESYLYFAEGYVQPQTGCCHCCEGCDHSLESGNCENSYYPDGECGHEGGPTEGSPFFEGETTEEPSDETTEEPSDETTEEPAPASGSCYVGSPTHAVYCAVEESACTSVAGYVFYEQGNVGSNGCCHCCNGCDHSQETGDNCEESYYYDGECGHEGGPTEGSPFFVEDGEGTAAPNATVSPTVSSTEDEATFAPTNAQLPPVGGSCYIPNQDHAVYCAVSEEACLATEEGAFWYESGYVSGRGGCCHCCNGCDHSLETGENCQASYYHDGECGHEGGPSEGSPFFEESAESGASSVQVGSAALVATILATRML